MFDERPTTERLTFTPCTRLSRMVINSQSNRNSRIKSVQLELPATNFNEKLMQVREEEENSSPHPNLNMFLDADSKISILDKSSKDNHQLHLSFSEDEESDEGDSSLFSMTSSPERICNKKSIFDDDFPRTKKLIFEEDDDDDDEDNKMMIDYYDPSQSWLSSIYHNDDDHPHTHTTHSEEQDETENRPPRNWHSNMKRTLPSEQDDLIKKREPLKEISLSHGDDPTVKKKLVISNGKQHKIRIMRALSPPRFSSKSKQ